MPASDLKSIGIIIFLIGVIFIPVNFFFPHTVLAPTSVQVPQQASVPSEHILGSMTSFTLQNNYYDYFYNVTIAAGLTFKMNWSSDTSLTAYILTSNQFNNYQSNQLGYGINYQATGSGRTGALTYDVQYSDRYVAMIINNAGASAEVYQFTESSISYTNQTQYTTQTQMLPHDDNLYLYLGVAFMI